jgi:uncharacterized damage-inducible protein DinB
MAMRDGILPEFDHEMKNTRKTLERVPEGNLEYKPHEKSMAMDRLAGHVAELPGFATRIFDRESLEAQPTDPSQRRVPLKMISREQLLEEFDKNVAAARAAIAQASDEELMKPWSFVVNGKPLFDLPRIAALRGFVMNHLIHHRAQLGIYLRLNDVPVPSTYGPSADEQVFGQPEAKSEAAKA